MNPLTSIPVKIRAILYWLGYIVGVLGQGTTIVWGAIAAASPDVSMPLGLVITSAVLGLLQTQLNLLSGSNVADTTSSSDRRVTVKIDADTSQLTEALDDARTQVDQLDERLQRRDDPPPSAE